MVGFGRTGTWFASDNWDVVPDIITMAKGINSGYVPLGAMIIREHLKEWVRGRFFPGGGGTPLSMIPNPCPASIGKASHSATGEVVVLITNW